MLVKVIRSAITWILTGLVAVFLGSLLLFPSELWALSYFEIPGLTGMVFYGGFCVLAWAVLYIRKTHVQHLILALYFLCFSLLFFPAVPLGDSLYWIYYAGGRELFASQVYGNLVFHTVHSILGMDGLDYILPVFGFIVIYLYSFLSQELARIVLGRPGRTAVWISRVLFIGWGGHLLFLSAFTENTPLSIPFMLLHIYYLLKIFHGKEFSGKPLFFCGLFLGLACLFHGANLFFAPAFPILLFLENPDGFEPGRILGRLKVSLLGFLAPFVLGIGLVLALGLKIVEGDVYGGADAQFFVPLFVREETRIMFGMFSPYHFTMMGNLVLCASPLSILFPYMILMKAFKREIPGPSSPVLPLLSLGYISLAWLFHFDMGFPGDYDLMVSLGLVLSFWFLESFFRAKPPAGVPLFLSILLLFAGTFINIGTAWGACHPVNPFKSRDTRPTLIVNGKPSPQGSKPVIVYVNKDHPRIDMTIRAYPHAFFFLLSGKMRREPHTLLYGLPMYIGGNSIFTMKVLYSGWLDENGRWKKATSPGRLPPGNVLNCQALVIYGNKEKVFTTGPVFIFSR